MSEEFIFQVEVSSCASQGKVRVEGRCCEGSVKNGDHFGELLIRTKNDQGSFSLTEIRPVGIRVHEVASIRPGVLGLGEVGTLTIEGIAADELPQDSLLKGRHS